MFTMDTLKYFLVESYSHSQSLQSPHTQQALTIINYVPGWLLEISITNFIVIFHTTALHQ